MAQIVDVIFKVIGSVAAIVAIFQLIEVKKKRSIDMYWKVFELYKFGNIEESRKVIHHFIPIKIIEFNACLDQVQPITSEVKEVLMLKYKTLFHDAAGDSEEKESDRKVRIWVSFLNQAAVLLKKRLIDKDMLFGLIGAALEIDYAAIEVIVGAHRYAHNFPNMYGEIEIMYSKYIIWKIRK
jgi:hypothetical protein